MPAFRSSHVKAASYDTAKDVLKVTFTDGATYDYASVGGQRWLAFKKAKSKGSYLHSAIEPRYKFRRE